MSMGWPFLTAMVPALNTGDGLVEVAGSYRG